MTPIEEVIMHVFRIRAPATFVFFQLSPNTSTSYGQVIIKPLLWLTLFHLYYMCYTDL